jgi:hypothetical protein
VEEGIEMILIGEGESKLEAVKALREFCSEVFGVNPELKDAIGFLRVTLALLFKPSTTPLEIIFCARK